MGRWQSKLIEIYEFKVTYRDKDGSYTVSSEFAGLEPGHTWIRKLIEQNMTTCYQIQKIDIKKREQND